MFNFFKKIGTPKTDDICRKSTMHMDYDGKKGYALLMHRVTSKYIAITVNNSSHPDGKVQRIMKITERSFYQDFGCTCTSLRFVATKFSYNS